MYDPGEGRVEVEEHDVSTVVAQIFREKLVVGGRDRVGDVVAVGVVVGPGPERRAA